MVSGILGIWVVLLGFGEYTAFMGLGLALGWVWFVSVCVWFCCCDFGHILGLGVFWWLSGGLVFRCILVYVCG